MKDREYRIGPGAVSLLLLVVIVSMSVLGLLALISARGDYKLTDRAEQFAVSAYEASAEAEYELAELDAILVKCMNGAADDEAYLNAVEALLPEGMEIDGRTIYWQKEIVDRRTMVCEVEILPMGSQQRFLRKVFRFEAMASDFF